MGQITSGVQKQASTEDSEKVENASKQNLPPQPVSSASKPTSDMSFLDDFMLDIFTKKDKISATSVRSAGAKASLEKFFGMEVYGEGTQSVVFNSDKIKTLSLEQYGDVFLAITDRLSAELDEYLNQKPGRKAYLMVTLKTGDKLKIVRENRGSIKGSVESEVPVSEVASGMDIKVNPKVSAYVQLSKGSALDSTGADETAFAAEYCEILRGSEHKFTFKGGIKSKKTTRMGNVIDFSGNGLSFQANGDEGDNEDEDDDDDEEDVYV